VERTISPLDQDQSSDLEIGYSSEFEYVTTIINFGNVKESSTTEGKNYNKNNNNNNNNNFI